MKKLLTVFILIIIFIIIYFLQSNFFTWFTIAGVMPNLFIILILYISLYAGIKIGIPFAILGGLFLDITIGKIVGTSAIMLSVVALIGAYFDKSFSKESKITIILMVIASTAIFEIGIYIINIISLSISIEILEFTITLLIEILFNIMITIILYPVLQKTGYKIENIFKGNEILTRYF